jgi:hypothetical protein
MTRTRSRLSHTAGIPWAMNVGRLSNINHRSYNTFRSVMQMCLYFLVSNGDVYHHRVLRWPSLPVGLLSTGTVPPIFTSSSQRSPRWFLVGPCLCFLQPFEPLTIVSSGQLILVPSISSPCGIHARGFWAGCGKQPKRCELFRGIDSTMGILYGQ